MRTNSFTNLLTLSLVASLAITTTPAKSAEPTPMRFSSPLQSYLESRASEFDQISDDRKALLNKLALHVQKRIQADQPARLTFICTHNSRRSQISQVWAATAARYYGIKGVETFSGGTETTAFNPRAVAAMQRTGLEIRTRNEPPAAGEETNPRYEIHFPQEEQPLICFSKVYNQAPNPQKDFCAVMCCSHADMNCPVVAGCTLRVSLPYEDPKESDGRPDEGATYDERCEQICREMMYVFSQVTR
ncbi:protein-tyrosine-phosphatase [Schlesneria sp. T3-172]|uniref:protein-tyrosine-phosphatase n=1 Tax=Schlesneria sphaerica TaxID=3373610 RepID=UPI0037CA2B37